MWLGCDGRGVLQYAPTLFPFHHRRQRHKDRLDVSLCLQPALPRNAALFDDQERAFPILFKCQHVTVMLPQQRFDLSC